MAELERKRPGRKLIVNWNDGRSAEVHTLVEEIHGLLRESDTTLETLGKESSGSSTKQSLSYQLKDRRKGPERHVVEYIVRHCCQRLGEAEQPRLAEFILLWEAANPDPGTGERRGTSDRPSPELLDLSLVSSVLQLAYDGERHEAARLLLSQHPTGGREIGQILAEVGRRTPGGVADLLDAVAEDAGGELADAYFGALKDHEADVAAAVEAIPRTRPRPATPPAAPDTKDANPPSILDLDKRKIDGRRRARLIRRGEAAQAAAEIVAEASTNASGFSSYRASLGTAPRKVDIALATELFVAVCREDDDDETVAAALLTRLIEDGYAELTVSLLHKVHQIPEGGAAYAKDVLAAMKRPELLSALDRLAEGALKRAPEGALSDLLAQAPASVTGDYLLKWELTKHPSSVDISRFSHLPRVLRSMVERDHYGAAQVLSSQMASWDVEAAFYSHPERPETKVATAVLDVARDDAESAGLLFLALLDRDPEGSARLFFLLEAPRADTSAPELVARIMAAAISRDPITVSRLVARMALRHDMPARILDCVAKNNADHGTQLASAMLIEDLTRAQAMLPDLVKQKALTLTGELLRQLGNRDSTGPWNLISHAVKDGDSDAAMASLDAYLPRP
ncbi:hypothetical protein ACWCQP_37350 [Streptomyces chartreusis]